MTYASPTAAKQAELLSVLGIADLADIPPNAALVLRTRVLNWDIESTQYLIDVVNAAKAKAVESSKGDI